LSNFSRIRRTVKRSPALKKAYYSSRSLLHSARLKALHRGSLAGGEPAGLDPSKVIWIFCVWRSGSTWMRAMLADLLPCRVWEEPKVGRLFGAFYEKAQPGQRVSTNFVLGDPTRPTWTRALRRFVLETASASHPSITPAEYLVVKEPGGAIGAPLLMDALPESRMVLLVRDPRDVVASALDAAKKGSWRYENLDADLRKRRERQAARGFTPFVKETANNYLRQIGAAKRTFDAYAGPKALVRYEDLRVDPLREMSRLCSDLRLPVKEESLARVVGKHSWENVPEKEKGPGKFYRKAEPGGWGEDLTPRQIEIVERITAPLIAEFYGSDDGPSSLATGLEES
jgi:sulfotransferase family protein